jgi:hypothetical protein
MVTYFLDSSAVVKRYVAEAGSGWVNALCHPSTGNTIVISQVALVEVVAALCQKVVRGEISALDRDLATASFRGDAIGNYARQRVNTAIFTHGGDLCRSHDGLRAYDAVQLACALALRDQLAPLGISPVFVSGDKTLLVHASAEGFTVDDPNTHP